MNKKDCKLGEFVFVMQDKSSLPRNKIKIKRIGKIVGVYSRYANVLLLDCDFSDLDNIVIKRNLYIQSFWFSEISKINPNNIKEGGENNGEIHC